jgi:hypothetical protein
MDGGHIGGGDFGGHHGGHHGGDHSGDLAAWAITDDPRRAGGGERSHLSAREGWVAAVGVLVLLIVLALVAR